MTDPTAKSTSAAVTVFHMRRGPRRPAPLPLGDRARLGAASSASRARSTARRRAAACSAESDAADADPGEKRASSLIPEGARCSAPLRARARRRLVDTLLVVIFLYQRCHLGLLPTMLKSPYRRCDIGDTTSAIPHRRYKHIADVISPIYIADVASCFTFLPSSFFSISTRHHGQRLQCRCAPRHRTLAAPMAARPLSCGAAESAGLATSAGVLRRERGGGGGEGGWRMSVC